MTGTPCPAGRFPTPSGVAVSPDGTRAYITDLVGASVSVLDTATNTITATIGVDAGPVGVAVSPDGTHIYVTNFRISGTVSVVDTATGTGGTSGVNVWDNPHWKCLS